jgi:hypothetical protein
MASDALTAWLRAEIERDRDDAAHRLRLSRMTAAHRGRLMEKRDRALAELAILDEYQAARVVMEAVRSDPGGIGPGVFACVKALGRAVALLGYGYRYRPGYREAEWKP